MLALAHRLSLQADNVFNLAIGPMVKCWKVGFSGQNVPEAWQIAACLSLTRPEQIIVNYEEHSLFLQQKGMETDAGAIAKGFIVDQVIEHLRQLGMGEGLINLGGNIHTLGIPYYQPQGWTVGLKKPFGHQTELIATIEGLQGLSVVTTGIYERYFICYGKLYHHLFDPQTGYPI